MNQVAGSSFLNRRKLLCLVAICVMVVVMILFAHPDSSFRRGGFFSKSKIKDSKYYNAHRARNAKSSGCGNQVLHQLNFIPINIAKPSIYKPTETFSVDRIRKPACANLFLPWKLSPKMSKSISCFKRNIFSIEQRQKLADILRLLDQRFKAANIDFIMYGGTMIGSWRFHGLIPYDDDMDFVIDEKNKAKAHKLLSKLHKENIHYRFRPNVLPFWKLDVGCKDQTKSWNCILQIDIFFYAKKPKGVRFVHSGKTISQAFPLTRRPFLGVLLSAFNDYEGFFKAFYGKNLTVCKAENHNASFRKSCGIKDVDCRHLRHFHPYVVRTQVEIMPRLTPKSSSKGRGKLIPIEFLVYNSTIVSIYTSALLFS